MAYGLNKVMLIGHLGSDPEIRYTDSQVAVVNFNVATNESYKDANGNLVERTEWHRVVAWRKLAELFGEYLKKGSKVYLEGKLQTRDWEDKDGNKRYTTEIVISDFTFLDSRGDSRGGDSRSSGGQDQGAAGGAPAAKPADTGGEKESDLPF